MSIRFTEDDYRRRENSPDGVIPVLVERTASGTPSALANPIVIRVIPVPYNVVNQTGFPLPSGFPPVPPFDQRAPVLAQSKRSVEGEEGRWKRGGRSGRGGRKVEEGREEWEGREEGGRGEGGVGGEGGRWKRGERSGRGGRKVEEGREEREGREEGGRGEGGVGGVEKVEELGSR